MNRAQLNEWMAGYYRAPSTGAVAAALRAVVTTGLAADKSVQTPLWGFFSEIFRACPERLDEWAEPYAGRADCQFVPVGLWIADTRESRNALARLVAALDDVSRRRLESLTRHAPPTAATVSVFHPAVLDYLWGVFLASGDEIPVHRIIDQVGPGGPPVVGGAAVWSLSANVRQHPRVERIVRARLVVAEPVLASALRSLLERAESSRRAIPA